MESFIDDFDRDDRNSWQRKINNIASPENLLEKKRLLCL